MSLPRTIIDREYKKFVETESGETAVRILAADNSIGFLKSEVTVGASTNLVVDVNLLNSFSRIDYIINFKDSPVTVTKSLKMVIQNNAGNLTSIVTERMGGTIDVLLNVTDDSVDAFLEIVNNEAYPLTVTFLKSLI